VTFGAGGGERDKTDKFIRKINERSDIPVAGHLTCVGMSKDEINNIAKGWLDVGVDKIVALRGDTRVPGEKYRPHPNGYVNAADMIKGLKKIGNFEIVVAGYPEKHPDSPSLVIDIENLKQKVDEGADKIITQFFFEKETFLRFRDRALSAGIKIPIIPGIIPIDNYEKIYKFSKNCGTSVPLWIEKEFKSCKNIPEYFNFVSTKIISDLVHSLQSEGIQDFHLYTLNKINLSLIACTRLLYGDYSLKEMKEVYKN
jgi:methylenetetrahydrofolate reductase (NADPH)